MSRYYTRVCNFYYGAKSQSLVKKNKTLPLHNNPEISFDKIEIITRNSKKLISLNEVNKLHVNLKSKVKKDLRLITKKKRNIKNLNFQSIPKIMGILNITPDSFSDGGKFFNNAAAKKQLKLLLNSGANLIDIGGESTRPGSKAIKSKIEWNRIKNILKLIDKKDFISLDTRKSEIMERGIKLGVKLINDVSGLNFDKNSIKILKKYKNVLLDI